MIQIDCPSCQTAFDVEEKLLRQSLDRLGQRHLRCSACKEVFVHTPRSESALKSETLSEPPAQPSLRDEIDLAGQPQPTPLAAETDATKELPTEFPSFVATPTPLVSPQNTPQIDDFRAPNSLLTGDFSARKDQKPESYAQKRPTKEPRKQSEFTAFLAFLILVTLIVLVGAWISVTHPKWFQASYWLETNI